MRVKRKGGIAYLKEESQRLVPKCDLGSATSGNGFGAFEKVQDFLNFLFFLFHSAKARPSSCLNAKEITLSIIYLLVTLKFGEKKKFGKYMKVPILFVRDCSFTRCHLNYNIPLQTSKCYRNICIK